MQSVGTRPSMVNRFRHLLILFCSNSWHQECVKSFALWGLSVVTKRIHPPHDTKIQERIQSPHIKLPLKPHWSLVDINPNVSVWFTVDGFSAPTRRETHTHWTELLQQPGPSSATALCLTRTERFIRSAQTPWWASQLQENQGWFSVGI